MRTVFKVICYVAAGFFLYMVCLLGFTSFPNMSAGFKAAMMAGFLVPGAIAFAVGLALADSAKRWRDAGIVLLSGAGFTVFLVATMALYFQDEEFRKMMPAETLELFSAYGFGGGFLGSVLMAGLICLVYGLRRIRRKNRLH